MTGAFGGCNFTLKNFRMLKSLIEAVAVAVVLLPDIETLAMIKDLAELKRGFTLLTLL
jgi:hypothetical protein